MMRKRMTWKFATISTCRTVTPLEPRLYVAPFHGGMEHGELGHAAYNMHCSVLCMSYLDMTCSARRGGTDLLVCCAFPSFQSFAGGPLLPWPPQKFVVLELNRRDGDVRGSLRSSSRRRPRRAAAVTSKPTFGSHKVSLVQAPHWCDSPWIR